MQAREYLTVLARRKWLIAAVTALVAASAVLFSLLQVKEYASKGRLLLVRPQSVFPTADSPSDPDYLQTEIEIVESEGVRALVGERLGSAPKVSAVQVGTTAIIEVTTVGRGPRSAAASTNAYMDAYLEFRRRQSGDAIAATRREIQATVDDLQARIDDLSNRLRATPCPATGDCPARDALEQERDARLTEQIPFRQRLAELNIDASATNVGAVVNPGSVPDDPVRPTPVRNALLGLAFGLMLGVPLALTFEYLDDSVRDEEDVERAVPGLPVLALIPPDRSRREKNDRRVVALSHPTAPPAEAYRRLRTAVRSLAVDRPLRWVQITSAIESEGKTTTAANLGFVLSRAGDRVIIVSWDLRQPRLHEQFQVSNKVGLVTVLLGEATLAQALQPVTDDGRLFILAAGPAPPNPSDLLSSVRAREVLAQLRAEPATVLFDCPPVLPVADATILAEQVDGTLLVARAGASSRKRMARALGVLRQAGAPVLGTVLHTASVESAYGYGYGYPTGITAGGVGGRAAAVASSPFPAAANRAGAPRGGDGVTQQVGNGPLGARPPEVDGGLVPGGEAVPPRRAPSVDFRRLGASGARARRRRRRS